MNADMKAEGVFVFAGGLEPSGTAVTLRPSRDGAVVTTNGPCSPSGQQLGGFWIVETPNEKAALKWAEIGAQACGSPVELRAFHDDPRS